VSKQELMIIISMKIQIFYYTFLRKRILSNCCKSC